MKYLEAYKDTKGFHFLCELSGPEGPVQKAFHYAPHSGLVNRWESPNEVQKRLESDPAAAAIDGAELPRSITIEETETSFVERIRSEIEQTCAELEALLQNPSKNRTDLGLVP